MKLNDIEERMQAFESLLDTRLIPDMWVIVRMDGHRFSKWTEKHLKKPFDEKFHEWMVSTAQEVLRQLQGIYAYTQSDEISILLPPSWDLFNRRSSKIISLSAGLASAHFTQQSGFASHFDSRIWLGPNENLVIDYFRWRQSCAERCALSGCCYWALRNAGASASKATRDLEGKSMEFKYELLRVHNIHFKELPSWQKRGVGLHWEMQPKEGYDPIRKQKVTAHRCRIQVEQELPTKEGYDGFLRRILQKACPSQK